MTDFLLSNFGQAVLADGVAADATTFTIDADLADRFPQPGTDQAFAITLWDGSETPQEIVYCTSNPLDGTLTVLRGQEDTTAQAWLEGTQLRHSITAGSISNLLQSGFILGNKANFEEAVDGVTDDKLMTPLSNKQAFDARTTVTTREFLLQETVEALRGYLGFITLTMSGTGLQDTFLLDTEFEYDPDLTKVFVDEVFVEPADYSFTGPDGNGQYSIVFNSPPPAGTGNIVLVLGVNFAFSVSFPGDNTVGTSAIIDLNVTTGKLANGSVTTAKLADGAVTDAKLAITGVDGALITDGTLTAAKLGPNAVTTAKILDANVTEAKIATGAVTVNKLGDASVTNAKLGLLSVAPGNLQDAAVEEAKIANAAVTNAKLGLLSVATGNIQADAVTTAKILDANVTDAKLAANSVTTSKILNANVTQAKLANGSVGTAQIIDLNVTTAKIANANVTLAKMAANSVDTSQLVAGAVTLSKMASNSVDTSQLVNDSVNADKIDGADVADIRTLLNVVSMSAAAGAVGTYAFCYTFSEVGDDFGDTRAGSGLKPCNSDDVPATNDALTGTWRCMGNTVSGGGDQAVTLWRRDA